MKDRSYRGLNHSSYSSLVTVVVLAAGAPATAAVETLAVAGAAGDSVGISCSYSEERFSWYVSQSWLNRLR